MKKAAFLGPAHLLDAAYSPEVRLALSRLVQMAPTAIPPESWREHRETLSTTELIFSTWFMPQMDEEFLAAVPALEAVFYAAGTVKNFYTPAAADRGVIICAAAGGNAIPVAEYCLAITLLSLKNFWHYPGQRPETKFTKVEGEPRGVFGATIGLVSFGAVARHFAGLLARHGVKVLAYDPHLPPEVAAQHGVTLVPLEELFRVSDVVSVHAPWLPETESMINEALLRSMKPGATFINTSRGAIVDERGLCEALGARPDLTAFLDVTHPEPPLPDSPLRTLPNVVLTPHIAGSMGGEVSRLGAWMLEEAELYLGGRPLRHRIDFDQLALMA